MNHICPSIGFHMPTVIILQANRCDQGSESFGRNGSLRSTTKLSTASSPFFVTRVERVPVSPIEEQGLQIAY